MYFFKFKGLIAIAIFEIKEEDAESQILLWSQLNSLVQKQGYP